MCGISAVVSKNGSIEPAVLARMAARLAHRGPDGLGSKWLDGRRVGLAHNYLRVLAAPDEDARQPLSDRDETVWITFNGFISNFEQLRAQLGASNAVTDTHVLVALYREHGLAMLRMLEGMFALVLYDARTGSTYYARDPFGIKPLYIRETSALYAFASEPGALRTLGPCTVDTAAVLRAAAFLYSPFESAGTREIRRVLPGEVGHIDRHGRLERLAPLQTSATHADAMDLDAVLRTSARRHTISQRPIGILFSGGLDSTVMARLLAEEGGARTRLFSMLSPRERSHAEERLDDPTDIERLAPHTGLSLMSVAPPPSMLDAMDHTTYHIGEPLADPAALATGAIAAAAAEAGVRVLLSGHGSDEQFAGYRRHMVAHHLAGRPRTARVLSRSVRWLGHDQRRTYEVFRQAPSQWIALLPCVNNVHGLSAFVHPDRIAEAGGPDALLEPFNEVVRSASRETPLRQLLRLDQKTYLPFQTLTYFDRMCAAYGIEGRVPYLNAPVHGVANQLHDHELIRGLETKVRLRTFARKLMGSAARLIVHKRSFGVPMRSPLHDEWSACRDRLLAADSPSRPLWRPSLLAELSQGQPAIRERTLCTMLFIDSWMRTLEVAA